MSDTDSSIAADADADADADAAVPVRRRCRRTAAPSSVVGKFCLVVFLSVESGGFWAGDFGTSFESARNTYGNRHAVGIGLCYWRLLHTSEEIPTPLLKLETTRCRSAQAFGYVAYCITALARFESPLEVNPAWNSRELMEAVSGLAAKTLDFETKHFGSNIRIMSQIVANWQREHVIDYQPKFLQFRFHCQWIAFIFLYLPIIFHVVSIGNRLARHRLCSHDDPSGSIIKRFIQACSRNPVITHARKRKLHKHSSWLGAHDVHVLLEWLRFSKNIKDQQNSFDTLQDAARVISRATSRSFHDVMHDCRGVSGCVLKAARVRLDAVCMLLFRKLWQTLNNVVIYLYMDSSPQHYGNEMYAVSMEILDLDGVLPFERKLLPLLSLSRDFLDSAGKATALCWIAFLLVGPTFEQMAKFLDRVVSVCSDMGAERLVALSPDLLTDFCDIFLGMPGNPLRTSLLPLAMQAPGWCHGWDIILKRGLQMLAWFPRFMEYLRSIIHFFRCGLLVQALCKKIEERGFPIISAMVSKVSIPSVAEWRWGTLHSALKQLRTIRCTLRAYWSPELFANAKDAKCLQRVGLALNSVSFHWQFKFVDEFSSWVVQIQSWGKGSRGLEAGTLPVDPMSLGRRLDEAGPYVESALQSMLAEASAWSTVSFEGASQQEVDCMQAAVRASFCLAKDRHRYLNTIPWLFARLDQPGVQSQCLQQYESCTKHHALTEMIMKPGTALRSDFDRVQADGSGASAELQTWIDVIKRVPLDDSIAESPHASGNRLGRHGSASSFSWMASSMRLGQNLIDVIDHSQALGEDLDELWYASTSVLQTRKRGLGRPMRCKPQVFRQQLYQLGRFTPPLQSGRGEAEANDQDHDSGKEWL